MEAREAPSQAPLHLGQGRELGLGRPDTFFPREALKPFKFEHRQALALENHFSIIPN